MTTDAELVTVNIPEVYVDLCHGWAGDADCLLRAISSTGSMTLGTNRPVDDDGTPMTDQQWHCDLWSSLWCDIGYCLRLASRNGNANPDCELLRGFSEFALSTLERLRAAYGK